MSTCIYRNSSIYLSILFGSVKGDFHSRFLASTVKISVASGSRSLFTALIMRMLIATENFVSAILIAFVPVAIYRSRSHAH